MLDMNFTIDTSGRQGMKLLREIVSLKPHLPVILMTGWATVQLAVEGMKAGARDFVAKPWENRALLSSVATVLELNGGGVSSVSGEPFSQIITQSPVMQQVIETAKRVATTDASVLITGESGTGKELIAEALHAASPRSFSPFVAVNLGGIPESLFESELFGHRAGAFTDARTDRKGRFELAEGGSLFFDEIGDLTLANQVKLLRVLQERRYERLGESHNRPTDVRVISATSRNLTQLVSTGEFREDLLYRINLIHLQLPALNERPEDIELLARHFLKGASKRYDRPGLRFASPALSWLTGQRFPGNIRQLQNLVERLAILSSTDEIDIANVKQFHQGGSRPINLRATDGQTLAEVEERMVRAALLRAGNNITIAAKELGLTRAALYRRLDKFHIRYEKQ